MDNIDPEYRTIIDQLRSLGHYSDPPRLPPQDKGGKGEPMKADWEPRVTRLELGFCAGMVLIFSAIIGSYLLLAGKVDGARDRIENIEVGEVRVEAKVDAADKKLDAIAVKLDRK